MVSGMLYLYRYIMRRHNGCPVGFSEPGYSGVTHLTKMTGEQAFAPVVTGFF